MQMDVYILTAERGLLINSKTIAVNNLMGAIGLAYNVPDLIILK